MAELVADCPRCGSTRITFDVHYTLPTRVEHRWQQWLEAFGVCRNCRRSTTFSISQKISGDEGERAAKDPLSLRGSLNNFFNVEGYISIKDRAKISPPEHLDQGIAAVFNEGATCLAVQCWNAAGTMFRKCVDLATRPLLPQEETEGLNSRTRRDLGLRLKWLFDNRRLPNDLRDLSTCIRQDGNDGAHGGFLTREDAEDLLDFTDALLDRMFTEPRRLELAKERRAQRRSAKG
jgi:hypothetical protein